MGEMVEFKSNGDMASGYLAEPKGDPGRGLILLQEWWGLVPHIKNVADRFAEAGFTTLVPDLYRGETASKPDDAMRQMMSMKMDRAARDMSGAVDLLMTKTGAPIGVVGFCMGGGLALMLGAARPDVIKAVAPFYGLVPWPSAKPDFSKMTASVLGHYAEKDTFAPPAKAREMEQQLRDLGKDATIVVHEGVNHAFFNDERPEAYNAAAATAAWEQTLEFLRSKLTAPAPVPAS